MLAADLSKYESDNASALKAADSGWVEIRQTAAQYGSTS